MLKVPKIIIPCFEVDGNRARQIGISLPATGQTTSYRTGDDGSVQAKATWLEWIRDPVQIVPSGTGYETVTAQGNWTTGVAYQYNAAGRADLVTTGGAYYICKISHTAGTFADDLSAGKWVVTPWTASAANVTTPAMMTWNNAIDNCLMTYAGIAAWSATNRCGWRLANRFEMICLQDTGGNTPNINTIVFPNTKAGGEYYWSSGAHPQATTYSHEISYQYGPEMISRAMTESHYVRPVRSLFKP